jgi:hypothetical protein
MSSRFARTAERYWRTYLPSQYATIEDPTEFFRSLSDQVDEQIASALRTPPTIPADATPQQVIAAHQGQVRAVTEVALHDLVFLPPEPAAANRSMVGTTLPGWQDDLPPTQE